MDWKWEIAVSIGISHHKGVPYFLNGFFLNVLIYIYIYIRWENVLACTVKTIYGAWYLTLEYTEQFCKRWIHKERFIDLIFIAEIKVHAVRWRSQFLDKLIDIDKPYDYLWPMR